MMDSSSSTCEHNQHHGVIEEAKFYLEINRLVREFIKSPLRVQKEGPEMFMNPQGFRPDTLYQINL